MRDNFDRNKKHSIDGHEMVSGRGLPDLSRLEDVGDLHFHASSHTTALDYYGQILDGAVFPSLDSGMALRVLQKAIDANLALDKLDEAEELLMRSEECLRDAAHAEDIENLGVIQAIVISRRSTILRERGQLQDALHLAKRAFSVLALTDEHAEVARLQVAMGICHIRMGRQEKAEEFFTDGLSTYRRIGNDVGVANLMNNLALLNKNRCRWDKALTLIEKAIEMGTQLGASHLLPTYFLNQGIILIKIDRLGEARTYLEKGLRLASSLGAKLVQARLSLAMGRLETMAGRLARAEEHILAGKNLAELFRYSRETIIADEYLGDILLARGEVGKARFNYQLGLEKSKSIASNNDLEGELLRRMGEVLRQSSLLDEAVATTQAAIAVCESCGEIYELGFCHLTLGLAYASKADPQQADHHFRESIATFQGQNLTHMWCQAILDFTEARLDTAGEAELLLLRRYLMDAQENGASSVSDFVLCRILNRLAEVQIRLAQFDDALLTVFELERHVSGLDDSVLSRSVVELRDRIEVGLLGGLENTEGHLHAISSIPGLMSKQDPAVPRNLEAVLDAGMERVEASVGFIAMADDMDPAKGLKITSRKGLTENLAEQLTRWFDGELASGRRTGTSLFSRIDEANDLAQAVPALVETSGSCVFMPISLHGEKFGLLFLGMDSDSPRGFDRSSLDFLSTYMGFLALFLFEKGRTAAFGDDPIATASPMGRINSFENIITQNVKMLQVLGLARKVAPSNLTVLLGGETGTGKGLLAYAIHGLSKRSQKKFMAINCAAIPETLLESELFGHVKGSFTGAIKDKVGLLGEAEGGTVFLDEVGKMPISMQGKLLHFLDSKAIRPVGSNQEIQVDVRIVVASKADLHQMAMDGTFLEDLYYRLLDFPLVIPPLRDRTDDIALLVRHFVDRFSGEMDMQPPMISRGFMDSLGQHRWPGNVRELEKTIKRAIVLSQDDGVLRSEHLPFVVMGNMIGNTREMAEGETLAPLKETLADIECKEISRALNLSEGNKSQASRMLQISYPNLLKKIRHYGIGGK